MYLDYEVAIPNMPGKITYDKKKDSTYVKYEYGRTYDAGKKYTYVQRATIGKRSGKDASKMYPNANFIKYFPNTELPQTRELSSRCCCLRAGGYIIIKKLAYETGIEAIADTVFERKEKGLFLDLVAYNIISENNAGQYYLDYAYNHPLFTEGMQIYSDSTVSRFLNSITEDQIQSFLNRWNTDREHKEKIYISYDSTNKESSAGKIEMVEMGHTKKDQTGRIFNYSLAYDTNNREPLFYEEYAGSIVDISQLEHMIGKAIGYNYRNVGFILDRGYFSSENMRYMDKHGYPFIIMVKGKEKLINELVMSRKGTFENNRSCSIRDYKVYGTTVKHELCAGDRERYFHIYHSPYREANEKEKVEEKIDHLKVNLEKKKGRPIEELNDVFKKYFDLYPDEKGNLSFYVENPIVIERERDLCGYFAIITSEEMTAKEALTLYKNRDASEKLFRADKSYLGNKSLRVYGNESASAKIFIGFVALIIRSAIYTRIKDAVIKSGKRDNFMTVPAVVKELEKIELSRQIEGTYRLDHSVTATQKEILKAFWVDEGYVKTKCESICNDLKIVMSSDAQARG